MQYTTNYNLNKPQLGEYGHISDFNSNSDTLDSVLYKHKVNFSKVYSSSETYVVGEYVTYEDTFYICIENVSTAEEFDPTKWEQRNLADEIGKAGYIELTASQYESLPYDVQHNGKMYCIIDGGVGVSNYITYVIYSKSERQIGVWTNGKPLYQISVDGSFENTSTAESTHIILDSAHIVNTLHIDELFITDGSFIDASVVDTDSFATCSVDSDKNLIIHIKNVRAGTIKYNVTIQYTKSTDVPGSGMVNQQALPSVHYSTAEHVIGTWINSVTLYERSFRFNTPKVSAHGDWTEIDTISDNIQIVDSEIVSKDYVHEGCFDTRNNDGSLEIYNPTSTDIEVKFVTIRYIKS